MERSVMWYKIITHEEKKNINSHANILWNVQHQSEEHKHEAICAKYWLNACFTGLITELFLLLWCMPASRHPEDVLFYSDPARPFLDTWTLCHTDQQKYIMFEINRCAELKWLIKGRKYNIVLNWEILTLTWRDSYCYKFLNVPGSNFNRGSVIPVSLFECTAHYYRVILFLRFGP